MNVPTREPTKASVNNKTSRKIKLKRIALLVILGTGFFSSISRNSTFGAS